MMMTTSEVPEQSSSQQYDELEFIDPKAEAKRQKEHDQKQHKKVIP
jgi:hypothetical protein